MASLPVKKGITSYAVGSIPKQWDQQWFRYFIDNFLTGADVRNVTTPAGSGIVVSGNVSGNNTSGTGTSVTITQAPIANDTVLGNVSGSTAVPSALNQTQLTALINLFSPTLSGAVPLSGGGTLNFLRADGTWTLPAYPIGANPTALTGLIAIAGVAPTFIRSDGAPALDQSISPTWTGTHTFNQRVAATGGLTVSGNTFISRGISDSATATILTIAATGAVSIAAPTSGNNALTVNGTTAAIAAIVISGLGPSTGGADLKVARAGSTANQAGQGPNLFLNDSTNLTGYYLQDSGGQFEIWSSVGAGPTLTQLLTINTSGGFNINAPTSGTALTVTPLAGGHISVAAGLVNIGNSNVFGAGGVISTASALLMGTTGATTTTLWSNGITGLIITTTGGAQFPNVSTTASAANAFLDNTNSNNLLRSTSSRKYKSNIEDLPEDTSKKIYRLRPIQYTSKASMDNPYLKWYGLIAEEVADIEPRLVHYDENYEPDGVQYDRISVLLLSEIKKMRLELDQLRSKYGTSSIS